MIQTRAGCVNCSLVCLLHRVGARRSERCRAGREEIGGIDLLSDEEAVLASFGLSECRHGSAGVGCCNVLSVSRKARVSDPLLCDVL